MEATPRQVSEGAATDSYPRWSPDGSRLAFRSDREKRGRAQVYLLPPGTGESRRLTDFGGGVSDFEWAPDGKSIAVVANDPKPERDEGDDRILYEDEARYGRLWIVDVESGAARRLTSGDEQIWEFCWAPDGSAIATITSDTAASMGLVSSTFESRRHRQRRRHDVAPARAADGASGLVARRQMDRRDDQYLE